MVLVVIVFTLPILSLGLWGLIAPAVFLAFVSRWQSRGGLWFGAILRIVFRVALWLVAPASRLPAVLQVLAVVSVMAGLLLPFVGVERLHALVACWSHQPLAFTRAWAAFIVAFGVFILWTVVG